ncbi:hypothetical protein ACHHYP_14894 [Achlya hypogyna]|uniref:RING-type domain-containing protein n=1 Tax=Achlya hypogyna TaxID=1202772 RepID=A0A1V9YBZ4_ACHHY|nr:hypothetical protein ACHHYP_14894 [Achlya hypogyna]
MSLPLSVRVIKAVVAEPSKTTHYELAIVNHRTQAKVTIRKRHRDFKALVFAMRQALQVGHACSSVCPWFYMDVQQKMPRPSVFSLFAHGRAVAHRIRAFQEVLDTILLFIAHPAGQRCPHTNESVPKVLYDFLFSDVDTSEAMYASPLDGPGTSWGSSSSVADGVLCSLCTRYLDADEKSACLTTLSCGHVFHDECIIAALNERLSCPCCRV